MRCHAVRLTFDAELAPGLLGELFGDVEVEPWDVKARLAPRSAPPIAFL